MSSLFTAPPAPQPGPPPFRHQEPGQLVLLTIVTLSVYFYVWLWRVSGEAEAWKARSGWMRPLVRATIVLAIVGLIVGLVVAGFATAQTLRAVGAHKSPAPLPAWSRLAGLVGVVGELCATLALRRLWSEAAPARRDSLAALALVAPAGGVLSALGVVAVGGLLTFVGLFLWAWVLYQTQAALNAAETPRAPAPAW